MKAKQTLLVTGVTGDVGKALIPKLLSNYKVVGCSRSVFKEEELDNFTFEKIDLSLNVEVKKLFKKYNFDQVIHLAATMRRGSLNLEETVRLFKDNVLSTFNILSNIKGADKLIYSSTAAVYGVPKHTIANEDDSLDPPDFYSKSKMICEELIKDFSQVVGFKYLILRIPSIFSKRIKEGALYNFARNAVGGKNMMIKLSKPTAWNVIYIDDVVETIIKCVTREDLANEIINVAYQESMELEKVAKKIREILKSDSKIIKNYTFENPTLSLNTRNFKVLLGVKLPSFEKRLNEYLDFMKDNE